MRLWLKISLAFVIITVILAVLFDYVVIDQLNTINTPFKEEIHQTLDKIQKTSILDEYAQSMKYYDEVLTQSARNYAFTQDKKWEERYKAADPALDLIIRDAIKRGDAKDAEFFSSVNNANIALLKLEYRSLELVDQGHPNDAIKILESKEYWDQKKVYQQGLIDYATRHKANYNEAFASHILELDQITKNTANLIKNETNIISILLLLFLTLLFTTVFVITRTVLRPLSILKNSTESVAKGNYNVNMVTKGSDEIQELASAFNSMVSSLKQSKVKLDQHQLDISNYVKNLEESNKELVENQIRINHYLTEASKLKMALDEASIVAITDKNGTITDVNKKFCEISKYSRDELIGQNHRILKSGYHTPEFYQEMWKTITSGNIWKGDLKNVAKDGTFYWVRTIILPVLDKERNPIEYIAVRTDITNQKKTEENLKRTLDELKETDKLKDEFASMVSHELRTPLIPIMGYCEMLMDPSLDMGLKESQIEYLREIHKNSKKLLKMIEDILMVQKLEMHQIKFEKKEVQLIPFMKNILQSYTSIMKDKMIKFTDITSENYLIKTDSDKLTQVFGNLIQNAVDFVPYNGIIEIGAKKEGDKIVFHVKDNGFGIPKEKQEHLFKKFYQVDTSMKRKHGGSGLGLSICKEIVEGLDGKIWVESKEGSGTTFYFSIPKTSK